MPLSSANLLQAKVASLAANANASPGFDNPTTPGGTVILEMYGPPAWPSTIPAGWDFDHQPTNIPVWLFRYSGGPGGETAWTFAYAAAINWLWRISEWDAGLDPISPLDCQPASNTATGVSVTSLSTGTTPANNRADTVVLASHWWRFAGTDNARAVSFSGQTNSFAEQAEQRVSLTNEELDAAWSWRFPGATGTFETTATVSNSAPAAGDIYYGMVAVYAATQPVQAPPGVLAVPVV